MKCLKVFLSGCFMMLCALGFSQPAEKIDSVVFDFGGVLSNFQRSESTEYLSKTLNVDPSEIKKGFSEYRAKHSQTFSEEILWQTIGEVIKVKLPVGMPKMFRDFLSERMDIHPEMKNVIKTLKAKGFNVYMLSNQNFIHYRVLREKAIFDLFDDAVVSHVVKVSKPDEKIYTIFLKQTGRDPKKCLFIDDKLENLEAAEKLGFKTLHFDIHKTSVSSFKKSLSQLIDQDL